MSRLKCWKSQKSPKFDILACSQAHFHPMTIYIYIYIYSFFSFFIEERGKEEVGDNLSLGFLSLKPSLTIFSIYLKVFIFNRS